MPNTLEYTDWLSMECLRLLTNKLQVSQFFNQSYTKDYEQEFAVGQTIRVPLPQRFTIRDGLGYNPQGLDRIHTTITMNQIFGVDFQWDDAEEALTLTRGREAVKEQILDPAMAQIAQEIDDRCSQFAYQNSNNIAGILGTDPTSFQTFSAAARQRLVELACPAGGKKGIIIPPSVNTALVNAAAQYFNPSSEISDEFREGFIGVNQGFKWYESMSLFSHTAGTSTTPTVNGANQSGSTLTINATAGNTFKKGDVYGIGSVYATNPMTRRVTTKATVKTVVITSDLTAAGGGVDVINISPALNGPGSQYQNVDSLPADGATLTLFPGTSSPNGKSGVNGLAIHNDAFALVGVRLEMPKAVELKSQTRDPESGISVRFVRAWNPQTSTMQNRFDVLLGFGALYPDNCCVRLLSA